MAKTRNAKVVSHKFNVCRRYFSLFSFAQNTTRVTQIVYVRTGGRVFYSFWVQ